MSIIEKFSEKLISRYKMKSLFAEYLIHILVTVTLPIVMLIFVISLLFLNTYKTETTNFIRSATEKNAGQVDNLFSQIDTYYRMCLISDNISALLSNSIDINNVTGISSPVKKAANEALFFDEFSQCIDTVYLYSYKADYVYGLLGSTSGFLSDFSDHTWYEEYLKREKKDYIACLNQNTSSHLTFCYNIGFRNKQGILVIKVSIYELARFLTISDSNLEGFRLISLPTQDKLIDYQFNTNKDAVQYTVQLQNVPVELTYSIAKTTLPASFQLNLVIVALSAVIIIILSTILAYTFARKQYLSILSVITALEDPNIQVNSPGTNELYYLLEKTKGIATTNKNLEKQLLEKITHLKKAQTIALQTQINPHFLFNTLNMISYSIQEEIQQISYNSRSVSQIPSQRVSPPDTPQSIKMVALLSSMLRYSLKTEEYIVTLLAETEVLKSYIEIALIKYEYSFCVNWNIAPDVYELNTIKSTLQPLVENAIEHGIKKLYRKKPGLITISVFTKQDILYINVTDNGVGMSEHDLLELEERLHSDALFQNQNIGLKNVISRIKLLFNDRGGFHITSGADGTSVMVYHPVITHELLSTYSLNYK